MKLRHILAAAALATAGLHASAAERVPNGAFTTDLAGWTLGGGTTFASGTAQLGGAADTLSITLNNLVANTQYTFDFDYQLISGSGNGAVWSLTGATSQGGSANTFGNFSFEALTNSLTISFHGTGNKLVSIDNVSLTGAVAAVPEPETYAMLMAGLGIVGFVARRRRAR